MDLSSPVTTPASLHGPDVQLKRHADRGHYDRDSVFAIIDEALICHVACIAGDRALSLPTAHARVGEHLYLHGARSNAALRALCESARASVTFTLLDGLVLARTAFHHSMNYRSVVVFGAVREVAEPDEKRLALHALVEHVAPGRMRELGTPSENELKGTLVLRLEIEQASAKVRAGGPLDSAEDCALDVWAGTVPLALTPRAPIADAKLRPDQAPSGAAWQRSLRVEAADLVEEQQGEYLFSTDPSRLQLAYVHRFLSEDSYWAKGLSEAAFRTALQQSLSFGVYRDGQQVGFARIVGDRSRFAYLCDVFIQAELRGQRVGRALIAFVLAHPAVRDATRCVLGTRDAHSFYEPFGFARDAHGRYMLRMLDVAQK
jgi:uncharacterized protein